MLRCKASRAEAFGASFWERWRVELVQNRHRKMNRLYEHQLMFFNTRHPVLLSSLWTASLPLRSLLLLSISALVRLVFRSRGGSFFSILDWVRILG